jgi:hypothetical protein
MLTVTIGPSGVERIKQAAQRIRTTIGNREISQKVRGLSDDELGALLNDVLTLVDEAEGIVARAKKI